MLILWNVYNFFVTYANLDSWNPDQVIKSSSHQVVSPSVLDEWILELLDQLVEDVTKSLDGYDTVGAIDAIKSFVTDFSTWYIRRSRDRVGPTAEDKEDKEAFYQTTHLVLMTVCKLMAPITPFLSEAIYRNITDKESVHLADWPHFAEASRGRPQLIEDMILVRKIVEMTLAQRKVAQIKVRQPLSKIIVKSGSNKLNDSLIQLIKDEVNVKEIEMMVVEGQQLSVDLDTKITPELEAEGDARGIVRKIQEERKKLETSLDEKVDVSLETWPVEHEEYIKKNALVNELSKGEFGVKRLKV